jgi:serine/threonine protein kinase
MRQPEVFGSYILLESLGVGGMAEVFAAIDRSKPSTEGVVAIKRMHSTIDKDADTSSMFLDEARICSTLHHPNIARLHHIARQQQNLFMELEYISAINLRVLWQSAFQLWKNNPTQEYLEKLMPLPVVLWLISELCEGLDYAHRRRSSSGAPLYIVHRDITPQNILITLDGQLKIIDFGIAKAADRIVRTQAGIVKGKYAYMAPEQTRGEILDHRADIFACGVLFYEMLTLQRCFSATNDLMILDKVRKGSYIDPLQWRPSLPGDIHKIVIRMLALDPQKRPSWASEISTFLFQNHAFPQKPQLLIASWLKTIAPQAVLEEENRLQRIHNAIIQNVAIPTPTSDEQSEISFEEEATHVFQGSLQSHHSSMYETTSPSLVESGTGSRAIPLQKKSNIPLLPPTTSHDSSHLNQTPIRPFSPSSPSSIFSSPLFWWISTMCLLCGFLIGFFLHMWISSSV